MSAVKWYEFSRALGRENTSFTLVYWFSFVLFSTKDNLVYRTSDLWIFLSELTKHLSCTNQYFCIKSESDDCLKGKVMLGVLVVMKPYSSAACSLTVSIHFHHCHIVVNPLNYLCTTSSTQLFSILCHCILWEPLFGNLSYSYIFTWRRNWQQHIFVVWYNTLYHTTISCFQHVWHHRDSRFIQISNSD